MEIDADQKLHERVMWDYLQYLNQETDQFILKGGTALYFCYGLDRFSEDLDFDGKKQDIIELTKRFALRKGYGFRVGKDTSLVKRCFLDYGGWKPLKIEVSYRNQRIESDEWDLVEGVRVYTIDQLAEKKTLAYQGRDRIRDLYDLGFICKRYFEDLSPSTKRLLRDALMYKGLEQFDYLVQTQSDPLINVDQMAEDFLLMHEKLGVRYDETEEQQEKSTHRSR